MTITQLISKYRHINIVLLGLLVLSGCTSIGAKKLPEDRFNYNAAIVQSRNEQMLLNLVRLRYVEIPDFLRVSSVITSYSYQGNIGVGTTQAEGNSVPDLFRGDANLSYSQQPTITYIPLAGQEFALRMFRPIPVNALFTLGDADWQVDILLQIMLQRINDVENMSFAQLPSPGQMDEVQRFQREMEKLKRFQRVLKRLILLLDNQALEVYQARQMEDERQPSLTVRFKRDLPANIQALSDELRHELNLDPDIDDFVITERMMRREADEITIKSRSLMSVMSFLSRGIDVPKQDRDDGRVVALPPMVREEILALLPLHVHTQKQRPQDPYVAVRYRNDWFYIDHSDIKSKRTFAAMLVLFQLAAPTARGVAPVLTLPAGR